MRHWGVGSHEGVAGSVAGSGGFDVVAVVGEAVDDGGCHVLVAEDGSPGDEGQVGGDGQGLGLVGLGNDLEQEAGSFSVDGQVAQLVDRGQVEASECGQCLVWSRFSLAAAP